MAMKVAENETFDGNTIRLANRAFKNCTLQNCTLIYDGSGAVQIEGGVMRNCEFHIEGPALATLHFLQAFSIIEPGIVEGWSRHYTGKGLRFVD